MHVGWFSPGGCCPPAAVLWTWSAGAVVCHLYKQSEITHKSHARSYPRSCLVRCVTDAHTCMFAALRWDSGRAGRGRAISTRKEKSRAFYCQEALADAEVHKREVYVNMMPVSVPIHFHYIGKGQHQHSSKFHLIFNVKTWRASKLIKKKKRFLIKLTLSHLITHVKFAQRKHMLLNSKNVLFLYIPFQCVLHAERNVMHCTQPGNMGGLLFEGISSHTNSLCRTQTRTLCSPSLRQLGNLWSFSNPMQHISLKSLTFKLCKTSECEWARIHLLCACVCAWCSESCA